MRKHKPVLDRFWAFVTVGDGCWEWGGNRKARGYGMFGIERSRNVLAHRFAYEITVGPIPDGMDVCHHCDNPACVRPDHLFVGTRLDNMRDMVAKGRGRKPGTHCKYGHEFTPENTATDPKSGQRRCRTCHTRRSQANRGRDRSKYETYEYRRAMYLKHREKRLAEANARYQRQKKERVA